MCRTIVVGLIYMTRSTVKSWRMLVAHDSRKQKSYRLNRPLHYYMLRRCENFSAFGTIAHGSFMLPPRSLASSRGCLLAIETLRSRFFSVSREPQTSRSHVTSALLSGLRFEVYVCTARSCSIGKWFTARIFLSKTSQSSFEKKILLFGTVSLINYWTIFHRNVTLKAISQLK